MRRALTSLLLCAAFGTTPASAAPDEVALKALIAEAQFSGSVSISYEVAPSVNGTVALTGGRKRLRASGTSFAAPSWGSHARWASVTKQVIGVIVLQEVGKGTIDLDQPIAKYLPKFASANAAKITVRQLLRHQSGLPNPDDTAADANSMAAYYLPGYQGSRDPLTGYCAGPVKGEPGGNWAYNNCDYIVAGALLEAVTGKSWQTLVQERIAKPLKLKSLQAFPAKGITLGGFIAGKPEPEIDFASFGAAGGLYGSADDLLAFDRALMSGALLGQKELGQLWDGRPELGFIALGQWVFDAPLKDCASSIKLVERRGAIGGVQVRNFMAPEQKIAIAIFADQSEADFSFGEIWQGSGFSHDVLNAAICKRATETK
jgi:CubicO group peptidase (beta-lactamase class C family)